ncbi:MAG: DUF945 family protein [Chloroflexi bacterium]|nr:DUF945 family protein [Chloroflexota bacterium]
MRKLMTVLMLLILAGLFASTYVCSLKTEENFANQVARFNRSYPGVLHVTVDDYQRGLLVSKVQTSLSLPGRDLLELQHRIRHFPWGIKIWTGISKNSRFATFLPVKEFLLETDIGLNGIADSRFEMPELTLHHDQEELQLTGLSLRGRFDSEEHSGDLKLKFESLKVVENDKVRIDLVGVNFTSVFREQQGIPLGEGRLQLEHLQVQSAEQGGFGLNGLQSVVSTLLENGEFSSALDLKIAELTCAEEEFSAGRLQIKLSGIAVATLRDLQERVKQLQTDLLSRKKDSLSVQLQLLGIYSELFKEELSIELEQLVVQTAGGELSGQGKLALQELPSSGSAGVFERLSGELQLKITKAAFAAGFRLFDKLQRKGRSVVNAAVLNEQAEQLAGALMQKGIFTRTTADAYQLDFTFERGQLLLNGQELNSESY